MTNPLIPLGQQARAAANILAHATTEQKNAVLKSLANKLRQSEARIIDANTKDITAAESNGTAANLIDRLRLDASRLSSIIDSVQVITDLPDPVGRLLDGTLRPNGLRIDKYAVPLGVIGIIFESRPNVAIDAAALCLKSGNACILRGGSDSWHTVQLLITLLRDSLSEHGLPADCVQSLPSTDRALVGHLLTLDHYIDVIVPRGGKSLIARVRAESRIPVFSHLDGICHTYVDVDADPAKSTNIVLNAKMRRTSVCGATECLLLHQDIATTIGKQILDALLEKGCEVRVTPELIPLNPALKLAQDSDFGHEFLAPIIAVAVVPDVHAAVDFINQHGSQHTDAILTENLGNAEYFLGHVNSAIALHNASTQFADGGEFGKGAEIGIATGKMHARGPVGLEELTTYQYRVRGTGQTRP